MSTGRYAPSPSGRMHLGNLMCCLLAWLSAKSKGGQVLLRIEDLDTQLCPRSYADAIVDDLAWLGLAADGPTPPIYQSDAAKFISGTSTNCPAVGWSIPAFAAAVSCTRPARPIAATGRSSTPGPAAA